MVCLFPEIAVKKNQKYYIINSVIQHFWLNKELPFYMNFTYYLQELRDNLQFGSERSKYYALKTLVNSAEIGINAIIEERENQAGIPDFTIRKNNSVIGYIEAKKIGEYLNKIQESEQLKRYLESAIGQNFILTNFLEFRWFQDGKLQLVANVGVLKGDRIVGMKTDDNISNLLKSFVNYRRKTINNYFDLAQQMAVYTKSVKFAIEEALNLEDESGKLTTLKLVFQDLLLPDLDNQNFADIYAQTIAYGLFTARVDYETLTPQGGFNRKTAGLYITNKIPFLKGLFSTVIATDIISNINWSIENLVELFANVDMNNILENFGQETKREDPVVHFYETFLAEYESSLRKSRGVYYTPEPVVSFMVKFVNDILDHDFDLEEGLGSRNVTILDPATGTGTFLYEIIKQIYFNFNQYGVQNWHQLFKNKKVLDRLYGFELLMTPYAIAHLKLQLLLESLGYKFDDNERLNIFLTNALDKGVKKSEFLFSQYISDEANQAAKIKETTPIHVVIGNPPYAGHSANKNEWISELVKDYYQIDGVPLNEKNSKWLQDDYVKFIRFGQYQIDQTEGGILAFITNYGYLDNPTFRGMRQNLMQSFQRIYIINLHGNVKKKEVAPNGSADENVFDIQQGVSILIGIKDLSKDKFFFNIDKKQPETGVFYYDLWGNRENKYKLLQELTFKTIEWEKVNPVSPFYLFIPQNADLLEEYNQGWKITDIMPQYSLGCLTKRDKLVIGYNIDEVFAQISQFIDSNKTDEEAVSIFDLQLLDNDRWNANSARKSVKKEQIKEYIKLELFRPFDFRYIFYHPKFVARLNGRIMQNFVLPNYGLVLGRQGSATGSPTWDVLFISDSLVDQNIFRRGGGTVFPLYIYPDTQEGQNNLIIERQANFSPEFLTAIAEKLGYTPSSENIFYYIYAVFHSPEYRYRYAPFLKIDFPRVPLISNDEKFTQLAKKGSELVNLHLLKKLPKVNITKNETMATVDLPLFSGEQPGKIHYQGDGENEINQITYSSNQQRITINKDCYFTGISENVWEFQIGGYQVLDKWLKDRKKAKRKLSSEDITHYQKIIVALQETMKIMTEIDQIIGNFPIN
jgi:predicted helicase